MRWMTTPPRGSTTADPPWLDDREQAAWRGFLTMHRQLMHALAQDMRHDGLSDSDFAVLVGVSEAPGQRIRAHELCATLQWEKSRLSKQITRMEARELVAREHCPHDARGSFVALTGIGREAIERAAPRHVQVVRALFFDALAPGQVDQLAAICAAVIGGLATPPGPPPG